MLQGAQHLLAFPTSVLPFMSLAGVTILPNPVKWFYRYVVRMTQQSYRDWRKERALSR